MKEKKRGCGFRQLGGLYLVFENSGMPCDRLPINIPVCPVCGQGIKFTRGFTWVNPEALFEGNCEFLEDLSIPCHAAGCPVCEPSKLGERAGLMWVGKQFYSPEEFCFESSDMGASKRVATIPRGIEPGETWILFAHLEAGRIREKTEDDISGFVEKTCPAIFHVSRLSRIEKIIDKKQAQDDVEVGKLIKRGITPVVAINYDEEGVKETELFDVEKWLEKIEVEVS